MRKNNHLINTSDLLETIVTTIEKSYADDISLFICYGSYITGDYRALSDIDFYFIPKTQRGYQLGYQFIIKNVGYDLWPISWERLTRLSSLQEHIVSIVMDGEILYASTEEDVRRFDDLKNTVNDNLHNCTTAKHISKQYLDRAKAMYFDLRQNESESTFIDAMKSIENLVFALGIANGTYTRKGIKAIEKELERFVRVPTEFLTLYRTLIRTHDREEFLELLEKMIVGTDRIWQQKYDSEKNSGDPTNLEGFYEEFKSIYNKLINAGAFSKCCKLINPFSCSS